MLSLQIHPTVTRSKDSLPFQVYDAGMTVGYSLHAYAM